MNGRNFLELALLVPGVSPTNVASTQLFPGDVGGSRHQPLGRQPAQPLEQLHRRRAVGQRRCRGTERHHLRRRRHRAVPGGDVGRAGGARPRARRLRQRRHQERHQRAARHGLRLRPRRSLQRHATRCRGPKLPMDQCAVRRQPRRTARLAIGRSTSPTSNSAASISPASPRFRAADRRQRSTRRLAAVGYRGPRDRDRHLSQPGRLDQRAREGRSPGQRPRSVERSLQPLRRRRDELARRRRHSTRRAPRPASTTSIRRSR